jgi:large subunit ribosomal protein L15
MRLNEIRDNPGARKLRKRVGRGIASGKGKTAGRGHNGQKSRSGVSLLGFEGGQMPLYRRLPKRGFKNPFSKDFAEFNIGALQKAVDAGKVDSKKPVSGESLLEARLVKKSRDGVKLLANGDLSAKLDIHVAHASKAAIAAVEKAGGSVTLPEPKVKPEGKGKARHRKVKEREAAKASGGKPAKAEAKAEEPGKNADKAEKPREEADKAYMDNEKAE